MSRTSRDEQGFEDDYDGDELLMDSQVKTIQYTVHIYMYSVYVYTLCTCTVYIITCTYISASNACTYHLHEQESVTQSKIMWSGYKFVGDNIDKNFRPRFQR